MSMKMPGVNISFTEKASTAVERGERGIVAMILKGAALGKNPVEIASVADIPSTMQEKNRQQVLNVLKGYVNMPKKVLAYMIPDTEGEDGEQAEEGAGGETYMPHGTEGGYRQAMESLGKEKWNYLVAPSCETDQKATELALWVGSLREEGKMVKAVLPNCASGKEYIVNYTTESVTDENGATYTAEEFCGRIAGILAGTPLSISCTYAPVPELVDCSRMKKAEMDAKVAAGELFVFHDGEKVKVARGVTSFVEETAEKGRQFRKIKVVDAMDMITDDIQKTIEDSYIGKYANSYDNKCVLLSAISNYFQDLAGDGVVSSYDVGIDIEANRAYLEGKGIKTAELSEDSLKKADTGDEVFLYASVKILDAIEEVTIPISI